jgi:hypothetical protein
MEEINLILFTVDFTKRKCDNPFYLIEDGSVVKQLRDPRVTELERLRASLDEALRHCDEFEARLKEFPLRASIRNLMAEYNFASPVPASALKAVPSEPTVTREEMENRFAALVVSCMSKRRSVA